MDQKYFKELIWKYYGSNKRNFAWRETTNPYNILVSEIMLQQTQTSRVTPKYEAFLKRFPTTKKLAAATLSNVLLAWQGLGYNRRAKALKKTAEIIEAEYNGTFPQDYEALLNLPGVGQSTAGALMAFAFNKPFPFIETNIRAVFIHFFFNKSVRVKDFDILKLVEETMDVKNPRQWYYALYDYGAMLKSNGTKLNPKSAHYKKQSSFKGSNREIRSIILKMLLKEKTVHEDSLKKILGISKEVLKKNLYAFEKEGLAQKTSKEGFWKIA